MDPVERARDVLPRLRPQAYAVVRPDKVANPIVEPLWVGVRVLAAVDEHVAVLHDERGELFAERPELSPALAGAVRAEGAILDGYVTKQATEQRAEALPTADMPTVAQLAAKPFIGIRRDRMKEAEEERERLRAATTFAADETVAFVATDLLWIDGESLLGVPLLERKRLLDSVVIEAELVRIGMYVRPPIDTWVSTWRRLGFFGLSYRAANSRYHPGATHEHWTTSAMPRR